MYNNWVYEMFIVVDHKRDCWK